MRRVSILSIREEQVLVRRIEKARQEQLRGLAQNLLLNDFLECVSPETMILAYEGSYGKIYWELGKGFVIEVAEEFFEDHDAMREAYQAIRTSFFENYLEEEEREALRIPGMQSAEPSATYQKSPDTQVIKEEDDLIIVGEVQETPVDEVQEEEIEEFEFPDEDEQDESVEQEAEEVDGPADEPGAPEEDEEAGEESQEKDESKQSDETEEPEESGEVTQEDEDEEDSEDLLSKVGELDANTLSGDMDHVDADEFSNLDAGDDEEDHSEESSEAPAADDDEEDSEDLLSKVGELDANTLSGDMDHVDADEFSNLDAGDDEEETSEESTEEPEDDEEDSEDLLSKVGELDANTLSGDMDHVDADEFSNLDAGDDEEETSDKEAAIEPAAEEPTEKEEPAETEDSDSNEMMDQDAIAAMVADSAAKKEEPAPAEGGVSPESIELEAKLEELAGQMMEVGMADEKVEALLDAVRAGKAPLEMVIQTVEKLKAK